METTLSHHASELESNWRTREMYWRRKLGRIRLGVEPVEDQLARYRRVTWILTAVPALLAVFFLSLFTAFGRPDIGFVVIGVLLLPIMVVAWLDHALLARRVAAYRAEWHEYLREKERLSARSEPEEKTSEPA